VAFVAREGCLRLLLLPEEVSSPVVEAGDRSAAGAAVQAADDPACEGAARAARAIGEALGRCVARRAVPERGRRVARDAA
jgi:hypothetical protein